MVESAATRSRVIDATGGDLLGFPDGVQDRFLVEAVESRGRVALVEHVLTPRALAAPLHRHRREDEYSYVLEGRVGARLGEEESVVEAGGVLVKPRGQWHTFWNAGDDRARVLEVIAPAGLEALFRTIDGFDDWPDPEELTLLADQYGVSLDLDGTGPIIEAHGLVL